MSIENWSDIEEIYHSALLHEHNERAAFLALTCAGNPSLHKEVAALLKAHDESEGFMDDSAFDLGMKALAAEEDILIGQNVGPYKILATLGRGGMGDVYLAHDSRLGRNVALKAFPVSLTDDAERVRRFRQEARAASKIAHPHVAHIYEIGEVGADHFITMELVDGITLGQRLSLGSIPLMEAVEIAAQIASALTAAHEAGVVHRDIKPDNIMLCQDSYVKVLDFGLAKMTEEVGALSGSPLQVSGAIRTEPGFVMGSVMYMSPEQARGQDVDPRTDIWSLGVVFYEMVTGQRPFAAATTSDVMAAVLLKEPTPLTLFEPRLSAAIDEIVMKMLRKDREQRYGTAREVFHELRNLKQRLEPRAALTNSTEARFLPQTQSETVNGAVPLGSHFYIVRSVDHDFDTAITRRDSIVLIKGGRQIGKTSLLARGLHNARASGMVVVITDFQTFNESQLVSAETLLLSLAQLIADKLELGVQPDEVWNARRGPSVNFERYMKREVLDKLSSHLVWGLDEVDRLFTCHYGSEVFGLFRSWHNARALEPAGPWQRLTMAISYATEAHLFISDLNQSPFNVGTRFVLEDFDREQVAELNKRYGYPLKNDEERERFYQHLSGHPFLTRQGLKALATGHADFESFINQADKDEGPFGNHLRRILLLLLQDATLRESMKDILQGRSCSNPESFYRLRSAGLLTGESMREGRPRCHLYVSYLERRL